MNALLQTNLLEIRICNLFACWKPLMEELAKAVNDPSYVLPAAARSLLIDQGLMSTDNSIPREVRGLIKKHATVSTEI